MVNKLFVAGLSYDTTSDTLSKHFSEIGTVVSAQVIIDKYTNQSKGFGFVEMSSVDEAKLAIDKMNGTTLDGRTLVVNEAKPRENNFKKGGYSKNNDSRSYGRNDRKNTRNRY